MIIYLLLIPITLYIDTTTNQYYIQLHGLLKASILEDKKELLKINLKVFFLNFYFYPLKKKAPSKKKKLRKKNENKGKNRISIRTGFRMLKSFKIKRLFLDIDTGNCISNAKLYPVFSFLKFYTKANFRINFEGKNRMVLCLKNRPIYLIKSYINF